MTDDSPGAESENTIRRRLSLRELPLRVKQISWSELMQTLGPILLLGALGVWLALHFGGPFGVTSNATHRSVGSEDPIQFGAGCARRRGCTQPRCCCSSS